MVWSSPPSPPSPFSSFCLGLIVILVFVDLEISLTLSNFSHYSNMFSVYSSLSSPSANLIILMSGCWMLSATHYSLFSFSVFFFYFVLFYYYVFKFNNIFFSVLATVNSIHWTIFILEVVSFMSRSSVLVFFFFVFFYPSISLCILLMFSSIFLNTWRIFKIVLMVLSTNSLINAISLFVLTNFLLVMHYISGSRGSLSLVLIWLHYWGNILLSALLNALCLRRCFHFGWWELELYLTLLPSVGYFSGLHSFIAYMYCQPRLQRNLLVYFYSTHTLSLSSVLSSLVLCISVLWILHALISPDSELCLLLLKELLDFV